MNARARDHETEVALQVSVKRIGTDLDLAGAAIFLAPHAGDFVVGSEPPLSVRSAPIDAWHRTA
jgi:hypothetical protein